MPDNTGRDARMKKEQITISEDDKKRIVDVVTQLMKDANLNSEQANAIGFVMPGTDGEPEKFVLLSDLERSLEDMALVHEIAINEKFQLKPPNPDMPVYAVQQTVKDAYWDLLREELSQSPPVYRMVIQLLLDIKQTFITLLRGNNDGALSAIMVVLDESSVRKLTDEHGAAVLEHNAQFIMKIMAMACCPARDAEVAALKRETEPIKQLRGIMEVLDRMKLDMANFMLARTRAQFVQYSVEYERKKFAELQAVCGNNFPATMDWLKRNKPSTTVDTEEAAAAGGSGTQDARTFRLRDVLLPDYYIDAYQELLQPDSTNHQFPELLKLDQERMVQLREEALQLSTCATVMQLTCAAIPTLANHTQRRSDLAAKLTILSADYPGKVVLKELLESLWVQVLAGISDAGGDVAEGTKLALKTQILSIDTNMTVYDVVWRKLMLYMKACVMAESEQSASYPVIFRDYCEATIELVRQFKRIVTHNLEVYGTFYMKSMQDC
ncbi:T-complex protein 11-like protein 2 [Anopheles maculipalpis]|uniref:T-complex protein 11-like protein 2 n=1 Tax=Anopheles maculipalpis TaxID=1496333 RepID=UPI0021592C2D|nr:T-complex protein 11-like protein 2 [Anopheles maculipalpis]